MEILIRGNKVDITESMSNYIKEKLSKLDKYLICDNATCTVLVKVRNYTQKIEVTIPLQSLILRAEEETEDFYSACDLVVNKLERQIRKNKSRLAKREKKTNDKEFNFESIIDTSSSDDIIKTKKISVKPMSIEEAILQMDLVGHDFYLFKNSDNDKYCVVYKRKDTGYGILESE